MPSTETPEDRGPGLLTGLLAPLRLPERVVRAVEAVADSLQHVGPLRAEVVRIRKQSEPLNELLPAVEAMKEEMGTRLDSLHEVVVALEGVETHLDTIVEGIVGQLATMHKTVLDLQDDVQRFTDRLPDPDAPGPLERARDAITGGD